MGYRQRIRRERMIKAAIPAVILLAILIFFLVRLLRPRMTGQLWLEAQEYYLASMTDLAYSTDDVVTLYAQGSIGDEDFLNYISVFEAELSLMRAEYEQDMEKYPVEIGSHTYETKAGTDAVYSMYDLFAQLYGICRKDCGDKDKLLYDYMAFQQEFALRLADYAAARQLTDEELKEVIEEYRDEPEEGRT